MAINNNNRKKNMGIREELLISFVVLTIVALGTLGITAGIFINSIGNTTTTQTSADLEAQIQHDLIDKSINIASTINSQLEQVQADVDGIAEAINDVLSNPIEFSTIKSYYHVDYLPAGTKLLNGTILTHDEYYPENQPDDIVYDPYYELNVSKSTSHYLIYSDSNAIMGNDPYNLTGFHGDLINRTANLDPILSEIWNNNPMYAWIYVDFEIGVQRTFPYTGVDTEIFGDIENDGHDYKLDDWYTDAKSASGNIVWTAPYIDPYLGWMISISRAVYNGDENPSNLVGVIGIDIRLDTITSTVGDISYLDTGYGFLIDEDATVISHPDVEFDPEAEEGINIIEVEPIDEETIDSMLNLETNFTSFEKNDEIFYVSYAPISISQYSLGIVAPQDEVFKSAYELKEEVDRQLGIQNITNIIIILLVISIVIVIGLRVANSVVQPIQKLTNLAISLSTENIKEAVMNIDVNFEDELQQDDEIGDLSRAFKNLLQSVKEDADNE